MALHTGGRSSNYGGDFTAQSAEVPSSDSPGVNVGVQGCAIAGTLDSQPNIGPSPGNYGGRFFASGSDTNYGGDFTARSAEVSSNDRNYGVRGCAIPGGVDIHPMSFGRPGSYGGWFFASGSDTTTCYGIYAEAGGDKDHAGYFSGNVHVEGNLSKGAGGFLIDHPLDPEIKTLRHSFVESPESLCLYRGKAKLDASGTARVRMPEYFTALTKEDEATVILTPIGSRPFAAGYEWNPDFTEFTIYGETDREVSYLVLADRDDPAAQLLRRPVEEDKGNGNFEKGKLLCPEAYGQTAEEPVGVSMRSS